jgi:ATP-dependent Lhr-like helicase
MLRRLEDRGEVRGGRFVTGFGGEQFALPEAVESLRAARHRESQDSITVAGADPMNLAGILVPGERVPALPGRSVTFCNGALAGSESAVASTLHNQRSQRRRPAVHHPAPVHVSEAAGPLQLF